MLKGMQDATAVVDSAGVCLFTTLWSGVKEVAEQLSAITGIDYTEESLMECGDRIYNLERLLNLKSGLTKNDDSLPPRVLNDPIPSGYPKKGAVSRLPECCQPTTKPEAGMKMEFRLRRNSKRWGVR